MTACSNSLFAFLFFLKNNQPKKANNANPIYFPKLLLKANNIKIYATVLPATKMYYDFNFKKSSAIVMGSEAHGLSKEWFEPQPRAYGLWSVVLIYISNCICVS